jgi:Raf kinase inhibitor-like YbhB/YbcL family protein
MISAKLVSPKCPECHGSAARGVSHRSAGGTSLPMPERWTRRRTPLVALALTVLLCGCGSEPLDRSLPSTPGGLQVTSASIAGGRFVKEVTCAGAGKSPSLRWGRVPPESAELAVLMVDRDGEGGELLHWVLFGIDPHTAELKAGATPPEAREGETSFGRTSYEPLCPPRDGPAHRYTIEVYALRDHTDLQDGSPVGDVMGEIDRLAIRSGTTSGTYRNTQ